MIYFTKIFGAFLHIILEGFLAPKPVLRSQSHLEPPLFGWSRSQFFCWPELRASFWQAKKGKPCSCDKHDLKAIYKGRYDPKKTYINNSLIKSSKWKILMYGAAFFYWSRSRPNLAGAGIGSGTSDFRSWSSPK